MNNQTMNTKTQIINLLRSTNREGIENVINFLENSDFFTARCHSHHKYTGGMADHALETLNIARMTARGIPEDSLIICCLLHDLCDIDGHSKYKGHGRRSAGLATKHCGLKLSKDEWGAIRYHMHREEKRPDHTPLGRAVYHADKISAITGGVRDFFLRG
jgi:HD superfamily phosphodiesterase